MKKKKGTQIKRRTRKKRLGGTRKEDKSRGGQGSVLKKIMSAMGIIYTLPNRRDKFMSTKGIQ